jgi:hypothetical protein
MNGIALRPPAGSLRAGVFAKRPSAGVCPAEPRGSPGPQKPFDSAVLGGGWFLGLDDCSFPLFYF